MDIIKQYDTWPYLTFTFTDEDDLPVDCRDFTVELRIKNRLDEVIVDAEVGGVEGGAVWIDEDGGVGEYHWQAGDTDIQGLHSYEFKFTRLADGAVFRLPQDDYFYYEVHDSIYTGS